MSDDFPFRLGIDLGGTKIEIALLQSSQVVAANRVFENSPQINMKNIGSAYTCVFRYRLATPDNYSAILQTIQRLVNEALEFYADNFSLPLSADVIALGIGLPGKIVDAGIIQNSNTVCLNGKNMVQDLSPLLPNFLRSTLIFMNDANCFVLSEALQGAAMQQAMPQTHDHLVFGVILGTGVGGGIVINETLLGGKNSIAGEWGHNALPEKAVKLLNAGSALVRPKPRLCYCGNENCIETFLSGSGFVATYEALLPQGKTNDKLAVPQILEAAEAGDAIAVQTLSIYTQQLTYALANVVNILDPHVIVLGGGLSNIPNITEQVEEQLKDAIFSSTCTTRVCRAELGDSSGVFGAAFLSKRG